MKVFSLLSFVAAVGLTTAAQEYTKEALDDRIYSLPGLSSKVMSKYRMFSGYINVDGNGKRNVFYWFVESLNDPVNDPVFFWTNGGPGCSGMGGFWTEHGPFRALADGSVEENADTWLSVSSGIFVEQPAGVGFSYVTDKQTTGDEKAAMDNVAFIHAWLWRFPNFQGNAMHLTSESYGGHYLPTLAKALVLANANGQPPHVNLKGVFVGNPYTDPKENAVGRYDTLWGHQMVSYPSWKKWFDLCKNGQYDSSKCMAARWDLNAEVGHIDLYALDYPVCNEKMESNFWFLKTVVKEGLGEPIPAFYERLIEEHKELKQKKAQFESESLEGLGTGEFPTASYQQCASKYMTQYLNRADVQRAIHVNTTYKSTWELCSSVLYNRTNMLNPMQPYYTWLIENSDLQLTIVSGDDDSVCGLLGTQSWIWQMGYAATVSWEPWYYQQQVAGYLTVFDTKTAASFKLVTVHGGGHMIPQTEAERSYVTWVKYLQGVF